MKCHRFALASTSCVAFLVLGSCGGGNSSTQATPGSFALVETNVENNEIWPLNRVMTFRFKQDVDFSTVN